jgi:nickel-dependent lactate racemase
MQVGSSAVAIHLPDAQLLSVHRGPPAPAIADVPAAVRDALENPIGFPALRRALTPDDHVAVLVDERLGELPRFVAPLLEHLAEARIALEAVTLLRAGGGSAPDWVDALQGAFPRLRIEEHEPHNRKRLSYLATTKKGRRVYLNRTAVDADQLVVLSRRFYDPLFGIGGAADTVFPALGDVETRQAMLGGLSMAAPGNTPWPAQQEAEEVAWLLGAPFFLQIIEGAGDEIVHVVGGLIQTSADGQRLQNTRWLARVDEPAETVIAEVGGDPSRHTFADLAQALACASRVVAPHGRIILVGGGAPEIGPAARVLRQTDSPAEALQLLKDQKSADLPAAFQWASAARRADLYVLSQLPGDLVEELFAIPLENTGQAERLIGGCPCLYLADADKTLAVLKTDRRSPTSI